MSDSEQSRYKRTRKQAVSIRMSGSDVRNIKRLAERLGARDSDIVRFAVKLMLGKLALLQDPDIRGRHLVPVFLESGPDLIRHFELDSARLSSIINEGVEPERRVDGDDIQLIAMNALQRTYLKLRAASLRRSEVPPGDGARGGDALGLPMGRERSGVPEAVDGDALEHWLRRYLYNKYLYGSDVWQQPVSTLAAEES